MRSDTSGFSNSAKLPITNSLVKCGLKRKIFSDHDEDKGPQDVNKSQNDQTILRAPIKRKVPPVVTLDTSEESSSEDEKMIRYLMLVFRLIISYLIYFFKYQSKKTNPCSHGVGAGS